VHVDGLCGGVVSVCARVHMALWTGVGYFVVHLLKAA